MFQIIISLPTAFFFYRLVFQLNYFMQLHVLVIFVILGVGTPLPQPSLDTLEGSLLSLTSTSVLLLLLLYTGADDVFVLVDAWKQGTSFTDNDFVRLVFTYRRTAQVCTMYRLLAPTSLAIPPHYARLLHPSTRCLVFSGGVQHQFHDHGGLLGDGCQPSHAGGIVWSVRKHHNRAQLHLCHHVRRQGCVVLYYNRTLIVPLTYCSTLVAPRTG